MDALVRGIKDRIDPPVKLVELATRQRRVALLSGREHKPYRGGVPWD